MGFFCGHTTTFLARSHRRLNIIGAYCLPTALPFLAGCEGWRIRSRHNAMDQSGNRSRRSLRATLTRDQWSHASARRYVCPLCLASPAMTTPNAPSLTPLPRRRGERPRRPPCSQNAHDETVLVRCAQWEGRPRHSPNKRQRFCAAAGAAATSRHSRHAVFTSPVSYIPERGER